MSDFSYNALPYPSFTFPQTHPDRLATLATAFGMQPAPPQRCRVLELGCGDGTNLLSFASVLPQSEFVGVDLSENHIRAAQAGKRELNLSNVEFHELDVTAISRERFGEFDFVVAHGLYSWVPDFVRARILDVYAETLAPNGVGYVSYNAFPGCHIRQMTAGMMKYHVRKLSEPLEKVRHATAFLNFLVETSDADSYFHQILQSEYEGVVERRMENIFHDDLAEINQPFYFYEFARELEKRDLQYLIEADITSAQTANLPAKVRQAIQSFSDDIVNQEQYLDFFRFRRFRQTLFCRRDINLDRDLSAINLNQFLVAAQLRVASENAVVAQRAPVKFETLKGTTFEIDHPLTKAALIYLCEIAPRAAAFAELLEISRAKIAAAENSAEFEIDKRQTAGFLLQLFQAGFVKLHVFQPDFVVSPGEFPRAGDFARWQATRGDIVTTLTGTNLSLENEYKRALLQLLDGTRDKNELRRAFGEKFANDSGANKDAAALPRLFERNLAEIAAVGLLAA